MDYRAPIAEFQFLFDHVVGYSQVSETELFADYSADLTAAILAEAGRLCEEVLAPLQRVGDLKGAVLKNGKVKCSPGFGDGFKAIAQGGWVGMTASTDSGGMGLPLTLATAVNDMMSSACLSLQLNPLMSQGQIEALEHHASKEIKAIYLPKLISGEWCGTMNLTEPQAGSDVGSLRTKAEANGDGSFAISGQKIFISWGDNDFSENVCHLVLARLPDGLPGSKGISLFMVPKFIPDDNGNPVAENSLGVVSLEHKMGLHGSPTAIMEFKNATGWMIGAPHGGLAAMFTMMNNARLGVGVQGIGQAEAAFQTARNFAFERKQGKSPIGDGTGTIIDHADVRRMVATMKAEIFAARSLALSCAVASDMGRATKDANWKARAAILTPIVKSFGTDIGCEVAHLGVQVHGGMGYIEETGAAQYSRDVRVTAIYEGTNGIQSMDLVGRKFLDGGEAAYRVLDEIQIEAETARAILPELATTVWDSVENLRETTEWLLERTDIQDRFAGSVPYLRAFARVLGGHFHLKSALAEGGAGARMRLADFYINRLLPEHISLLIHAKQGAKALYAITPEDLETA